MKQRLDQAMFERKLVQSRSQAESYIKLGFVSVDKKQIIKPSFLVSPEQKIILTSDQYVSRAALKLASIANMFDLDFRGKTVLDVGSSTGGFTDYALQHGASRVIAVDVGTDQLHPKLKPNPKIELHEKTDIRDFINQNSDLRGLIDIVLTDVSFISLRQIIPSIKKISTKNTQLILMCKPQFEAGKHQINKGVIKNSKIRRTILHSFEQWLQDNGLLIHDKADSQVAGSKGNVERFYNLTVLK
jgi:23S rRNA (cytidine1920-2'-O)/16S rRNA (cytidine1409-2'-O)-methyltransferase